MLERTLVILKPDAVQRKLCGKIITMFEEAGFNIVDAKMTIASRELVERHYPNNNKWYTAVGNKSITNFQEQGLNIVDVMGTDDALEIGKTIKNWLVEYITSGPVLVMVLEGNNAIKNVRKMCGNMLIYGKISAREWDISSTWTMIVMLPITMIISRVCGGV